MLYILLVLENKFYNVGILWPGWYWYSWYNSWGWYKSWLFPMMTVWQLLEQFLGRILELEANGGAYEEMSYQLCVSYHFIADFRIPCHDSIIPFLCELYRVVFRCAIPKSFISFLKLLESSFWLSSKDSFRSANFYIIHCR